MMLMSSQMPRIGQRMMGSRNLKRRIIIDNVKRKNLEISEKDPIKNSFYLKI